MMAGTEGRQAVSQICGKNAATVLQYSAVPKITKTGCPSCQLSLIICLRHSTFVLLPKMV